MGLVFLRHRGRAMGISVFDMMALQHLWSSEELRAIFTEENRVQKCLDFEAALAAAQARLGIIPDRAAQAIAAQARVQLCGPVGEDAEMRRTKHSLVPMLRQLQAC